MVEITPTAQKMLNGYLKKDPLKVVRIGYMGLGCSGPMLTLSLEAPPEGAKVEEVEGLKVVVDEDVLVFSDDQVIDYIKNDEMEGFSVTSSGGISCGGDCNSCSQ
jgi:Fe-S cluster assembly iron-binding protein IscA